MMITFQFVSTTVALIIDSSHQKERELVYILYLKGAMCYFILKYIIAKITLVRNFTKNVALLLTLTYETLQLSANSGPF